jgi:hypothetical protein
MDDQPLFLQLQQRFHIDVLDLNGEDVHQLSKPVHIVKVIEIAGLKMVADRRSRKAAVGIQHEGRHIPVVG